MVTGIPQLYVVSAKNSPDQKTLLLLFLTVRRCCVLIDQAADRPDYVTLDFDHKTHGVNMQSESPYLNDQILWSALLQQSKETPSPNRAWFFSAPVMASVTSHCQCGVCGDSALFSWHPLHLWNRKWRNLNLWPTSSHTGNPERAHPTQTGLWQPWDCVGIFRGMKHPPSCVIPSTSGEWTPHMGPGVSSSMISLHWILLIFSYNAPIYCVYFYQ